MTVKRILGPGMLTIIWGGTSEFVRLQSADYPSCGHGKSAAVHVDFEEDDSSHAKTNLDRALRGSTHRPTKFRLDMDNGDAVRFSGMFVHKPPSSAGKYRIRVSGGMTDAEGYEMLEENPLFNCLAPDAMIWRYMNMAQFCLLGLTGKLHMQSIVGHTQIDPYEGLLPTSYGKVLPPNLPYDPWPWLISSWCLSDYNNFALWNIYGDPTGVAIQTTICKLKEHLYIGEQGKGTGLFRIAYLNYGEEGTGPTVLPRGCWLQDERLPFLCKRREFEHEKEVRLLHKMPDNNNIAMGRNCSQDRERHPSIPIDNITTDIGINPKFLVENVYAHPRSERWVGKTIMALMKSWEWRAKFIDNREPRREVVPFVPPTANP